MPPCLVWSAASEKLQTFDEEAPGQREIDQGYMALTALMERIVVNLLVTGKMGFLMEICT